MSLFVFGKNEPQSEPLNRIAENLTKNRRFSLSAVRRYAIMNTEDKIYKGDDVMFFYTKEEVIKLTPSGRASAWRTAVRRFPLPCWSACAS